MRPADYLVMAVEDIRAAKLRSSLTALGIVVGVGAVTLMLAIGHGVTASVTDAFTSLGSTRLTVFPSPPRDDDASPRFGGGRLGMVASSLTPEDADAVGQLDGVKAAVPVIDVAAQLDGPGGRLALAVTGTRPAYLDITSTPLVRGLPFTVGNEVILDGATAARLFGASDPLGGEVRINEDTFRLVGILGATPQPFAGLGRSGTDQAADPVVLVPVEAAMSLARTPHVAQITAAATDPQQVERAIAGIESTLRDRHGGVTDFSVTSIQELVSSFTQVFGVITAGLAAIAGISLLVGGIGIMNIMLATVTERTREIGISKAIGGSRAHIVWHFIVEAVMVSLIGGVVGLALAWLAAEGLRQGLGLPSAITPGAITLAVGVSAGVGLVFAAGPAFRAARLDPVVALRHE